MSLTVGITPDITLYRNTTHELLEKWKKTASVIQEDWDIIKDDLGEVVDALPIWHVSFKDGSNVTVSPSSTPAAPEAGIFDPKDAAVRDTKQLINKHINALKGEVEVNYLIAKNSYDETAAVLPCRKFVFKTGEDIVAGITGA